MKFSIAVENLALKKPFTTSAGTKRDVQQVFVRAEERGLYGYGAALVDGAAPSFRSGVDQAKEIAVWDLYAKTVSRPLAAVFELRSVSEMDCGLSLGCDSVSELIESVERNRRAPILKIKFGIQSDPAVVHRIRERYTGRIWVDGNGSWDRHQAIEAAKILSAAGVELLEQPIARGFHDDLKDIHDATDLIVVADEDCQTLADLLDLRGKVAAVNIKIQKCGGLLKAQAMAKAARSLGFRVMIGCKTETVLGVAAAASLAGLADYLDLDGHVDIENDPFFGFDLRDGKALLPSGHGLGVDLRRELQFNDIHEFANRWEISNET